MVVLLNLIGCCCPFWVDASVCSWFQRERLEAQVSNHAATGGGKESKDDAGYQVKVDEDFLTALEYGMPPTGGMVRVASICAVFRLYTALTMNFIRRIYRQHVLLLCKSPLCKTRCSSLHVSTSRLHGSNSLRLYHTL